MPCYTICMLVSKNSNMDTISKCIESDPYMVFLCTKRDVLFSGIIHFPRLAAGMFSHFRLRGMQRACVYTSSQIRAHPRSVARALWAFEVASPGK